MTQSDFSPGALPVYRCKRIQAPFPIDGDLSKPIWQSIPAVRLRIARDGSTPYQATAVRGCWDGEHLYLGFECQDQEARATLRQRDDLVWQEEAVEAFIAPYGDLRHYREFQCSPLNVVRDVQVTSPNARAEHVTFDGAWDCPGWETAVSLLAGRSGTAQAGWQAEWRIPLAGLLDPGAGPVRAGEEWRLNLYRIDRWPREEYSSWAATPGEPFSFHRPTCFGRWIFE